MVWKEDLTHGYLPYGQFGGASALSEFSLSFYKIATDSRIQLAVPMEKWQYGKIVYENSQLYSVITIEP